MAITEGVNMGFVTTAPTSDPEGTSSYSMWDRAFAHNSTSPPSSSKITEIGFYVENTGYDDTEIEVGLYENDGGAPGNRLFVSSTSQTGTTAGWKVINGLNWSISASTVYWIAVQGDADGSSPRLDRRYYYNQDSYQSSISSLPATWGGSSYGNYNAIYALVEVAATGTNTQINIGDAWKDVDSMKINIGDAWKDVAEVKQNIGDAWKTIF